MREIRKRYSYTAVIMGSGLFCFAAVAAAVVYELLWGGDGHFGFGFVEGSEVVRLK